MRETLLWVSVLFYPFRFAPDHFFSLCLTGDVELVFAGDREKLRQRARSHHGPLSQPTRSTGCYSLHLDDVISLMNIASNLQLLHKFCVHLTCTI